MKTNVCLEILRHSVSRGSHSVYCSSYVGTVWQYKWRLLGRLWECEWTLRVCKWRLWMCHDRA